MAFDWKSELRILQMRLKAMADQSDRDHYYHAIIQFDGAIPESAQDLTPGIFASGVRVAQTIQVALPEGY